MLLPQNTPTSKNVLSKLGKYRTVETCPTNKPTFTRTQLIEFQEKERGGAKYVILFRHQSPPKSEVLEPNMGVSSLCPRTSLTGWDPLHLLTLPHTFLPSAIHIWKKNQYIEGKSIAIHFVCFFLFSSQFKRFECI